MPFLQIQPTVAQLNDRGSIQSQEDYRPRGGARNSTMLTSKNQAGNAQDLSLKGSSRLVWKKETGAGGTYSNVSLITTSIRATHTVPKICWGAPGKRHQE